MHCQRAVAVAASVAMGMGYAVAVAGAGNANVLYMDNASGSNCSAAGPGTATAPFCTIQAAANAAVAGDMVAVTGGSHSGNVDIASAGTAAAPIVFQATGAVTLQDSAFDLNGASYVTVSRSAITGGGTGVLIDSGGSGIDISEDGFSSLATGVSVTGTPGTDIVSNTFVYLPHTGTAITAAGGSTGTTIENDIVANLTGTGSPDGTSISVDSSSTTGTTLDYNVVYPVPIGLAAHQTPYSWAGASYTTAAALQAATGQGTHDLDADPQLDVSSTASVSPTSPETNSASASAPGARSGRPSRPASPRRRWRPTH